MLAEQYCHNTGVTGARGNGDVVTPSINDNEKNRKRLSHVAAHPGQYTFDEFRKMIAPVFTSVNGKAATNGTITNWITAMFKSDAAWLQAEYGITRTMNGTKTDTITVPAKATPAKTRKGKAKVQQATIPGLE